MPAAWGSSAPRWNGQDCSRSGRTNLPIRWWSTLGAWFGVEKLKDECLRWRKMVSRVVVHFALEQCHDLLDNDVAGIHFYTLNRSDATRTIFDSLGIPRQRNTQVPIA